MLDPRIALLLYLLLLLGAAALFWPERGLFWRALRRLRVGDGREAMEDALKHLYKSARFGTSVTLESMAGATGTSTGTAAQLLDTMQQGGLVEADNPMHLTDEGQRYALQVIRTHRLWERYLADRTGLAPQAWHSAAEAREHELRPDQVEALSEALGHPRYDPHGDPIPTAGGEMPAVAGQSLNQIAVGTQVRIVHIEDEPHALYQRLLTLGLHPGMPLTVEGRGDEGIALRVDGESLTIDRLCAENVTVEVEPAAVDPLEGAATLASLHVGARARVLGLAAACQGSQRRRLLDLGVVPGTEIEAELVSASGGATGYRIRGALIALREEQQRWIRIQAA
jgi:DtxR family Mn-dependent transcriptional regulator